MCGGSGVVDDSPGRRRHRVSLTGIAPLSVDVHLGGRRGATVDLACTGPRNCNSKKKLL